MQHCARQVLKCNLLFLLHHKQVTKEDAKLRYKQSEPTKLSCLFLSLLVKIGIVSSCTPLIFSVFPSPVWPLATPFHFYPTHLCSLHRQGGLLYTPLSNVIFPFTCESNCLNSNSGSWHLGTADISDMHRQSITLVGWSYCWQCFRI